MKKLIAIVIALLALFAVITQYFLMLENRTTSVVETTIRFFSFFTILANSIVAVYFVRKSVRKESTIELMNTDANSTTAITVYISVVGLIYQILLRDLWNPKGMQELVDELLHSVIPVLVLLYWFLYTEKSRLMYIRIFRWLLFPLVYLLYILARGQYAGFYPYPFVNVAELGLKQVLINALGVTFIFLGISALLVSIAIAMVKKKS
jgi:hypothetical protein